MMPLTIKTRQHSLWKGFKALQWAFKGHKICHFQNISLYEDI